MRKLNSDPRCWWCQQRIGLGHPYRGTAPELDLPLGSGVVVCSPLCDERPTDAVVCVHPRFAGRGVPE